MDIEGAEYEVLEDIINKRLDVRQILLEFHPHLIKNGTKKTKLMLQKLSDSGYKCFGVSKSYLEYSFIKSKFLYNDKK